MSGLLWDAKLCAGGFSCFAPRLFPAFVADLWAALFPASSAQAVASTAAAAAAAGHVATDTDTAAGTATGANAEALFSAAATRGSSGSGGGGGGGGDGPSVSTLCYMSRGRGVRRGGMENDEAMRAFVLGGVKKEKAGGAEGATPRHGCASARVLDFSEGAALHGDFAGQAAAAAGCSVLFGPHGAGMAHLIWMARPLPAPLPPPLSAMAAVTKSPEPPRRTVLEVLGVDEHGKVTQNWYYRHLAAIAGLDYEVRPRPG